MALAKLANGIDELHGAIDSVKEGKKRRARLVCRWCDYGPGSYAEDGSKLHQLFYMNFPEGPRFLISFSVLISRVALKRLFLQTKT